MVEKETQIEKMKRLSDHRENIRNICTSAHIHHGKCVAPSTRIYLANGAVCTAENIYSYAESIGKKVRDDGQETVYDISGGGIKVFSLNKATGVIEKKEVSHAWRIAGGSAIKVRLRTGNEITTTPEHKYIILENMDFVEREARELRLGDRIVCARSIRVENSKNLKEEILRLLSQKRCYARLFSSDGKNILKRVQEKGIDVISQHIGVKAKSLYHGLWKNRCKIDHLLKISGILGLSFDEVYNCIDTIMFRETTKNTNPVRLPKNFEHFFALAGLLFGDGSGHRFIVGKESLAQQFVGSCKELNIVPRRRERGGRTPEIHANKTLHLLLNSLFDYPLEKKSHNIKVSRFLAQAPISCIKSFLRAYFDCDGTIEKSRGAISLTSVSKQMLKDVQTLLLRFECIAILQGDTLYISGISAQNFVKRVGFSVPEKIAKSVILSGKVQGSTVSDTIPFSHKTLSNIRSVPMSSISNHYYKYEQEILTPTIGTVLALRQKMNSLGQEIAMIDKLITGDVAFIEVSCIESVVEPVVYDFSVPDTKNFVAEGMVIHNTAFTDNLLAAAGLMSEAAAGSLDKGMETWQHADEQERLMTVDAANVSMVHSFGGQEFLINLIDTPGHIDFGGNVTRAMRAIDGTIVLACASEGIMPQTETVLKQALRERVKPVLFINKVDRLITELQFTPEQMQERFVKIVLEFNRLIEQIAEPQFKKIWQVNIGDGSVAFGSARENWALSVPFMKKRGVSFKDILNIYNSGMSEKEQQDWIWKHCQLHEVALDMVIKHLPNPLDAQKYRIPKIWSGDVNSEFGKDLINCNKDGKVGFVVTRILIDKYGREIAAGRLYSGTLREGMTVYLNLAKQEQRIAQVLMYQGIKPESIGQVPAGNVLALAGISATAGETITLSPEEPFEELKHIFEPVISKAIEPAKPQDLSKLVEVLRKVAKEDPSVKIEINQETGENLMHGMGELHLEIIEGRIKTEKGMEIKTSPPIVVFRESITKISPSIEGKSPNKHNKLYFHVEPLSDDLQEEIKNGNIREGRLKKKDLAIRDILVEKGGMDSKTALGLKAVHKGNLFFDATRGIVQIGEIMELILDMFEDVMNAGPLAREPCVKVKVVLDDAKLHEDAIHRGPAQTYPAVRDGIRGAMMQAGPVMYEPLQIHLIEAPIEYTGDLTKLVSNKRGTLLDMRQEGMMVVLTAKLPVAEMLGWSSDLRSATGGRGYSSLKDQTFEKIPGELQGKIIQQLRTRKGLTEGQVGA